MRDQDLDLREGMSACTPCCPEMSPAHLLPVLSSPHNTPTLTFWDLGQHREAIVTPTSSFPSSPYVVGIYSAYLQHPGPSQMAWSAQVDSLDCIGGELFQASTQGP